MQLREYQHEAARTDQVRKPDDRAVLVPLLGIAGEAGELLSEYKKYLREGDSYKLFADQVSEELGDILWYVANLATKFDLDLDELASENLEKVQERWSAIRGEGEQFPGFRLYDEQYPEMERLPRRINVAFVEITDGGRTKVELRFGDRVIGDQLTDNAYIDDGYRFHDVVHLTNAMVLGWSPVTRAILRCKRKTDSRIDEVEDGARAAVTEEAISALIFNHASHHSYFENSTSVDYRMLRTIKDMTSQFEVRDRSAGEWQHTILEAYKVWRQVRAHGGGRLIGDMMERTVRYEPFE